MVAAGAVMNADHIWMPLQTNTELFVNVKNVIEVWNTYLAVVHMNQCPNLSTDLLVLQVYL